MKRILIVGDIPFLPAIEGNRRRLLDLIDIYMGFGFKVSYILADPKGDINGMSRHLNGELVLCSRTIREKASILAKKGARLIFAKLGFDSKRNYQLDDWYPSAIDKHIKRLKPKCIDVLQCEYVYLSRCLCLIEDTTVKILDAHDVFSDRWCIFPKNEKPNLWYSISSRSERQGIQRADHVLAISKKDEHHFKRLGLKNVHLIDFISPPSYLWKNSSKRVLFVGSDNRMNITGLTWFIEHVIPVILNHQPHFRLSIAGSICNRFKPNQFLELIGQTASLQQIFETTIFSVNPVSIGSGLPIKNIDALSHGIPIICTQNAARGTEEFINKGIVIASSAEEFAEKVLTFSQNLESLNRFSQEAYQIYCNKHSAAKTRLANLVNNPL